MRFRLTRFALLLFPVSGLLGMPSSAHCGDAAPLFASDTTIEATMVAPFERINEERNEDDEHSGTFRYNTAAGEQLLDVKVRIRGRFRARKSTCEFAPLRLNFRKQQVRGSLFDDQDKLKLVTHCDGTGSEHEQYVLREYLAYRFLSAVTDLSLRTRLLKLTYIDSDGKGKPLTRYAFLVEHEDGAAKRLDAELAKVSSIEYDQLDRRQTNLFTVFSYFIGNTDFSAIRGAKGDDCCHNALLLRDAQGLILPIPYDFDFSGMVNAPYAGPNPDLPIDKVTARLYRGLCRNNDLVRDTLQLFRDRQNLFIEMVNQQEGLSSRSAKEMRRFIDSFYRYTNTEGRVKREFINRCSEATTPADQT